MIKYSLLPFILLLSSVNCFAMEILVPAYFYPSSNPNQSYWDEMTTALQKVNITAIMNPDNGPNKDGITNPDYARVIADFHQSPNPGQVIGYVYTQYGNRPIQDVLDDIIRYKNLYDIDGIFLDEMSTDPGKLNFFNQITNYIRQDLNEPGWKIIGNPGTSSSADYAKLVDVLITHENDYAQNQSPAAIVNPNKEGRLFYNVNAGEFAALLNKAVTDRVSYLYITDDNGSNPWDTLPSYWNQEVNAIAAVPEPLISSLILTGLSGFIGKIKLRKFLRFPRI